MENEILNKLEKIDKNTTQTLNELLKEKETLSETLGVLEDESEKRKEQLREAQKKFKTVGFKAREEIYESYESYAKEEMGASSLSAFLREYTTLLFESRDFQKVFNEFQILQKNDEKHQQVGFFVPQTQYGELDEMAENEGFTLGNLTKMIMTQLLLDKTLRNQIISKIRVDSSNH